MSDNWLRLTPTDPTWVPGDAEEAAAVALIHELAPASEEVEAITYRDVTFIDAGANFESVSCPACATKLDLDWWSHAMDTPLATMATPCCGAATTLNDLVYFWPQGFSRWVLQARSPGRTKLTDDEHRQLERVVGHPLREIWTHV